MSSNGASKINSASTYTKVILHPEQTLPEVLKCNKCKQTHASRLDKFGCGVNLTLNNCDFNCANNSIFYMTCAHSEISNPLLDNRSKVEAIAAAIILCLCESWCKREVGK